MITLSAKDMVMYFLACINSVRDSPLTAIKLLHSLLKRFVNEEEYADEWAHNIHHLTKEGKPAVVEAIKHLEDHPNRTQKLALSQTLCDIAYDLGTHISRQQPGADDHKTQLQNIMQKQCVDYVGQVSLIVEYGFYRNEHIITSMLVDDGIPSRQRRHTLLDQKWKHLGLSVHQHLQYNYCVVILLADTAPANDLGCNCSVV